MVAAPREGDNSPLALVGVAALVLLVATLAGLAGYYYFSHSSPQGYSELSIVSPPAPDMQSVAHFSVQLVSHEAGEMHYSVRASIAGVYVSSGDFFLLPNESKVIDFSIPSAGAKAGTYPVGVQATRVEVGALESRPVLEVSDWLVVPK